MEKTMSEDVNEDLPLKRYVIAIRMSTGKSNTFVISDFNLNDARQQVEDWALEQFKAKPAVMLYLVPKG